MYYVYLLKTLNSDGKLYIGFTRDLRQRFAEHCSNKVFSTKNKGIWKLIYYEAYASIEDAQTRERNLKYFGKAYTQLKKRLKESLKVRG